MSIINQSTQSNNLTHSLTNSNMQSESQIINFPGFLDETFAVPISNSNSNSNQITNPPPLTPLILVNNNNSTSTPNQQPIIDPPHPPIINPDILLNNNAAIPPNFKDEKKFPNINRDKLCSFLTKGKCRYGAKGENLLGKCEKYHPNQCRAYNLNGSTENGCKNGNKCSEWHATYICRSSANSRICNRVECPFKHHKNCNMKQNNNEHFLENKHAQMIPRQHPGNNFPINHRMPLHQHQTGRNFYIANQRQPPYQQQSINQPPQVPQDHMSSNFHIASHREPHYYQQQSLNQPTQVPQDQLIRMIRTIIREENYQYHM